MSEAGPADTSANRSNRYVEKEDEDDSNTFKVLISTDNHLGYNEECPIRCNDSFNTFEEVLQLAQKEQVDFVLLGGDLFHKNKPSRRSLFKCINLLRKYSLGNKPCSFELLSDPNQTFPHSSFPWLNTEDSNLNVGIPIFSINGNHDDPTGSDNLCALDILSASGLVNFFGKVSQLDEINISPLVFRKGNSKLCLFGLSSIRDERLHRMFRGGKVNILFPEHQESEQENWFHLMVLHQNHARHGPTNHIPESFLHPGLDLVVWGHEHEAMEKPIYNPSQDFYVLQPGSSVATSLSPGEAVLKNSWILHVRGDQFKADKVPLQTVRPFVFRDLNLFEESQIDKRKPKSKEKVNKFCCDIVQQMLDQAKLQHTGHPMQPVDKPLLRLRVHFTADGQSALNDVTNNGSGGDAPLNLAMFGRQFLDRVANAKDLVTLHRKTEQEARARNALMKSLGSDMRDAMSSSVIENNSVNLHTTVVDLVKEFFHSADESEHKYKLSVLTETGLSLATQEYVEKEEATALHSIVKHQIKKTVQYTVDNLKVTPDDDSQFEDEIVKYRKDRLVKAKELLQKTMSQTSSTNMTTGLEDTKITESQQEAIAELAEALKHHKDDKSVKEEIDLTTLIDDEDQEEYKKILESTRIQSRGAASARGSRGRGRARGAKTSTSGSSSRGISGRKVGNNNTLDLTKITSNKTQSKLQLTNDDPEEDADVSSFLGGRASKRSAKRTAANIHANGSDIDDQDDDEDGNDFTTGKNDRRAKDESQNVFSRRMTAVMRNTLSANMTASPSNIFSGSERSSTSGNQAKLARRF